MDWSFDEVNLIVLDYFEMLRDELTHRAYSKAAHRKKLSAMLNSRSDGSIERKHMNITAILCELQLPYIRGYKPLRGYQKLLKDVVVKYIEDNRSTMEPLFHFFAEDGGAHATASIDFDVIVDDAPTDSIPAKGERVYRPIKINYLEREQYNRKLGEQGEKLVFDYEKWRLTKAGQHAFARKIEWVSKEAGDGLGYDILSKNLDGSDRFIEVKTTKLSKAAPFFLTANELEFSVLKEKHFFLYRVFNFGEYPKMYCKNGPYSTFSRLEPVVFKGYV